MTSPASGSLKITYPTGQSFTFTLSGSAWTGIASNPDRLSQTGNDYVLARRSGERFHFQKLTFYRR